MHLFIIILKREMVLAPRLGVWTISFFDSWNFRVDRYIDILKLLILYIYMMKSHKNYKK